MHIFWAFNGIRFRVLQNERSYANSNSTSLRYIAHACGSWWNRLHIILFHNTKDNLQHKEIGDNKMTIRSTLKYVPT